MRRPRPRLCLLCLALLALTYAVLPSGSDSDCLSHRGDEPDARLILEQVLNDLLTNPDLKSAREFYGTPGDKTVALVKESTVAWPKNWHPRVPGYEVQYRSEATPVTDLVYWYMPMGPWIVGYFHSVQPRLLGVHLDKLNLSPDRDYDDQISVCLFNIGGYANGDAGGGCIVYYTITRRDGTWVAEYESSFDP